MERTVIRRTVAGYELKFVWYGGAYIDICWADSGDSFDVINVWDYAKDEPTIERTRAAMAAAVDEWINEPEASHEHDLYEYRLAGC
jgi:hypothetical protein